jgi:hypothetical protein
VMQDSRKDTTLSTLLPEIDVVALQPAGGSHFAAMKSAAVKSISEVLRDFLAQQKVSPEQLTVIDGFTFLFNDPEFSHWHRLNWWEQRRHIQAIKDHPSYIERAQALLAKSCLAPYIGYSDDLVAKSNDREVKCAWMRKRLVLQECFWNVLDSISHAAYFQKKYRDMFPALCVLLCNVPGPDGRVWELVLGIDNGAGFIYKKKSRESGLFRFFYKIYKSFFKKGVFHIGGLKLGLLETESELSCHGSGAVVYQGCDWDSPVKCPGPVSGSAPSVEG